MECETREMLAYALVLVMTFLFMLSELLAWMTGPANSVSQLLLTKKEPIHPLPDELRQRSRWNRR